MNRSIATALALTVVAASSFAASDALAGSWVSMINCTGKKLTVCAYDTGDLVKKFESADGTLEPCKGTGNCADSTVKSFGCGSKNGCAIMLIESGQCIKGSSLITRSLHQHSWKIVTKGSGYDYVQVSPDWHAFDTLSNRTCK